MPGVRKHTKLQLKPSNPIAGTIARRDAHDRKRYAENRAALKLCNAMGIKIAEARQILASLAAARSTSRALDSERQIQGPRHE